MKASRIQHPGSRIQNRGFTLIELLVVIAIMAILAALIIPGTQIAMSARKKARARTELQQVATMIENYKTKLNYYPPSANNASSTNSPFAALYYELAGTRLNAGTYTTLDGVSSIPAASVITAFGVQGFNNVTQGGGDEGVPAQNFTKSTLRAGQFMDVSPGGTTFTILGTSVEGPVMLTGTAGGKINPFGYNSANPTQNPNAYDLWLDILIRGKTLRIYGSPNR
jgi:prepilin-type N-terminal cleavage/methylation domain-containing protein